MKFVQKKNGFIIREREGHEMGVSCDFKPYAVFHPHFISIRIADFKNLAEAELFCSQEDAEDWSNWIISSSEDERVWQEFYQELRNGWIEKVQKEGENGDYGDFSYEEIIKYFGICDKEVAKAV
ncbi:hypothetical protein ABNF65_19465 [Paenibacillus larvae]